MKKYQITVTQKQLQVIGLACECFGRIQYGQPDYVMRDLPLGFELNTELSDICRRFMDSVGIFRIQLDEHGKRECDVAFDMWRKIIRDDDIRLGSEPMIEIVEIDNQATVKQI